MEQAHWTEACSQMRESLLMPLGWLSMTQSLDRLEQEGRADGRRGLEGCGGRPPAGIVHVQRYI